MKMTKKIGSYLTENNIDPKLLSEATGVSIDVLGKEPVRAMNATEFLVICAYLHIKPEEIATWE